MGAWAALATAELSLDPAKRSTDIDDETAAAAVAAMRAIYADAIRIVAPRVARRFALDRPLVAAAGDGTDQLITDAEWQNLASQAADPIGDSVLDGVIAGASTFASLPPVQALLTAVSNAIGGLMNFASQLRKNLDGWIQNAIGEGITGDWGMGAVEEALRKSSPLSENIADTVTATQTQAALNAGLYAAIVNADPAAIRWTTMRDERVRPSHVAADEETVLVGEPFMIGGYPAKFPGDPDLPAALRWGCRCSIAYVEGTEARRVGGSTKAELRAKATALSIDGRGAMSKGELQHAVLKSLCLQGMAGGPDCPDTFDQMNQTALLTLARSDGITGRYAMTREQLVTRLRQSVRGGSDISLTAKGYSTNGEFASARQLATTKRRLVERPGEFAVGSIPPPAARRASRQALVDEFGGSATGVVPCTHCGLRLAADPSLGYALVVPEPIVAWSHGGSLALDNLLPSCPSCFRARGGRGLVASASFTHDGAVKAWQSRDHGNWTPTMSRADAEQWSAGSSLPGDYYHGTSVGAAHTINASGFDADHSPILGVAVLGQGVYLTPDRRTAEGYSQRGGQSGQVITAKIRVSKPATLADLQGAMRDLPKHIGPRGQGEFIRDNLRGKGFDSINLPAMGETIVFDAHNVVIVDEPTAQFTHDGAVKAWQSRDRGDASATITPVDHAGFQAKLDSMGEGNAQSVIMDQSKRSLNQSEENGFDDDDVADAWRSYTEEGHEDMNAGMRTGEWPDATIENQSVALQRGFTPPPAAPLPSGAVIYRGSGSNKDLGPKLQPGDHFADKGFVSTSAIAQVGRDFSMGVGKPDQVLADGEKPLPTRKAHTLYVIRPNETTAKTPVLAGVEVESEYVLPPDSTFSVGNITEWVSPAKIVHRIIDLTWESG